MNNCHNYLALKAVCYKFYNDLQLLLVLTYYWKNLLMYFYNKSIDINQLKK